MTEIMVDAPAATAALDRGRSEAETAASQAHAYEPQSTDPAVAELLRALGRQTGDAADRAEEHTVTGADAADGLVDTDAESAGAIAASPTSGASMTGASPSSRVSSATVNPSPPTGDGQSSWLAQQQQLAVQQMTAAAQQQQQMTAAAAQQQQQLAAQQQQQQQLQMMAAQQAAAMAAPTATSAGLPPGTIFVDPNDLASLVDSVTSGDLGGASGAGGGESSAAAAWTGSTAPDPISIDDVRYDKTHGTVPQSEISAAVDSAMSKTGIEDPAARAKWKPVLEYMAWEESTNNASAVNNWDSNATGPRQVDGSPAGSTRGLWQTRPSTFAAYHAAGTSTNIYDPEASAGAAINYMKDRYDIGVDGSGLDEFYAARAHGDYVGY